MRKEGAVRGGQVEVDQWGDGTCDATPQEALDEVETARVSGTL